MLLPRTKRISHPHIHPTRAHTHTFGRVRHDENGTVASARAELHDAVDGVERQPSGLGPVLRHAAHPDAHDRIAQIRGSRQPEGGSRWIGADWRTMASRSEPLEPVTRS